MTGAKTLAPMCCTNGPRKGTFLWLVTEDILDEYKEVLKRLRVRSTVIGAVINLIRE